MTTQSIEATTFTLRGDAITLEALMKAIGAVGGSGEARLLLRAGSVRVNGAVETRRGRKLRAADHVACSQPPIRVVVAAATERTASPVSEPVEPT